MKILIIEDENVIREILQELLERSGHEVLAAASGPAGIALLQAKPEFIFCDVTMPGMDGFAVLEAVRQREGFQTTPFVFLTAKADRVDQRRAMALGADDYITKPFTLRDILEAIAARTKRQQPMKERIKELTEQRRRAAGGNWSHELLTPLNGILVGLELLMLELRDLKREDLEEIVTSIRAAARRQERLSRKIIRYFELESLKGASAPARSVLCQAEIAVPAGVQKALANEPRANDVTLECEPAGVMIREVFLVDAVAELVGNALNFSEAGSPVQVSAKRSGGDYQIVVTDQGPGMAPADRASVAPFTQFGRGEREQQGLGLGLAIVQSVARIARGRLDLEDGPGGRGLRATLVLPLMGGGG